MTQLTNKYVPSQYTHLASVYSQNEFNAIQKILRNLAYNCLYNARYPILKLLKAICRRMLINEFEGIFFAFAVQVNKWNISDQVIQNHCQQVRDIVCYSTQNSQYKSLTLYLLLCAYTVKYYLNENIEMFTIEVNKICPNFEIIFETWAKQYAMITLKINPKYLNHAYKQIFLNDEQSFIQYDYNSLVDNLLQISPSYNAEKEKEKEKFNHFSQNNSPQEIPVFQIIKHQYVKQQYMPLPTSSPLISCDSVNIQRSKGGLFQQSSPSINSSNNYKPKTKQPKKKNNHHLKQLELLNPIIQSRVQQSDFQESKFTLIKQQYIEQLPLFKKLSGVSEFLR